MRIIKNELEFEYYTTVDELAETDKKLLLEARHFTDTAYAPYSHFNVAAVAILQNGEIVRGTNQENASYPVGMCAERALLAAAGALHPNVPIITMAISYHNHNINMDSNKAVSPCGMCRQALAEAEIRFQHPIRLILSGMEGEVIVVKQATHLLPLSFSGSDLKK